MEIRKKNLEVLGESGVFDNSSIGHAPFGADDDDEADVYRPECWRMRDGNKISGFRTLRALRRWGRSSRPARTQTELARREVSFSLFLSQRGLTLWMTFEQTRRRVHVNHIESHVNFLVAQRRFKSERSVSKQSLLLEVPVLIRPIQ